jgi:lipopolysaccharide/colanic/teichoic acid biosynthesis glycosyltransferase
MYLAMGRTENREAKRMHFPASRSSFRVRFALFDVAWAAASPAIALFLRNVNIASSSRLEAAELYCMTAFAASLVAFLIFRIRDGIAHHFAVHDALEVAKSVVLAELLTTLAMFTTVRMEGIPRSMPIIHALTLATGLIVYRVIVMMRHHDYAQEIQSSERATESIVIIGCTRLSSLYTRMMRAYAPGRYKIVAILDDDPHMIGKSIDGISVIGPPKQLGTIIKEFSEHGIVVSRVLVGTDRSAFAEDEMSAIEQTCADNVMTPEFIPTLVGLGNAQSDLAKLPPEDGKPERVVPLPAYFRYKRIADIVFGMVLLICLLPVFLLVAGLVLLDVGFPVLFWQQRIGIGGRPFLLYKFRTLKPLFNERGLPIGTSDRVSWAGSFLRKCRLDELPQLLSVMVGDMSLVGPRPLLPQDQPADASLRLAVRPGVTGWAQVKGGNWLTPAQKNEFDAWYVRNASLWLDLRILLMTFGFVLKGDDPPPQPILDPRKAQTAEPRP